MGLGISPLAIATQSGRSIALTPNEVPSIRNIVASSKEMRSSSNAISSVFR
jgi:hypothetical protein